MRKLTLSSLYLYTRTCSCHPQCRCNALSSSETSRFIQNFGNCLHFQHTLRQRPTVFNLHNIYEGASKIFQTHAIKVTNLTTKRVLKLPASIRLRATTHIDTLDMVILPSSSASRHHNCCIDLTLYRP
jgi:hypothetical protein